MRKLLVLVLITVTLMLCSCGNRIVPLENPEPELFSNFYVGENYTLLKRTIIPEMDNYTTEAYGIGEDYIVGSFHMRHYRVLYNDEYFNIVQGEQLGLYTVDELIEMEVPGITQRNGK